MLIYKRFLKFIGGVRMKFFKKRIKQFISLICALAVLTPYNLNVSANDDVKIIELENSERLDELHVELSELIFIDDEQLKEKEKERILEEMVSLGAEILTQEQVNRKLPVSQRVSYPSTTSNVTWTSRRTVVLKYGVNYEVQVITAVPTSTSSSLAKSISKTTIKSSSQLISAGALKIFDYAANAAISSISGFAGTAISLYQLAGDVFSSSQMVSNVEATYTGTVGTQVKFCYVKKNGESDNNQQLSFRANAATTSVSTAIPNFTCSGNGSLGCTADNINKKVNSTHKSKEFDNVYNNAIDNFRKGTSTYSSAGTITLKGAQGKTVTSFTASMPSHMGQIY